MVAPTFIDIEQQRFFEINGYVKLPLLSHAQVARLTEIFSALHPIPAENFSTSINDGSPEQKRVIQQAIFDTLLPVLGTILVDHKPLIGSFLTKRAGPTSKLDFHQDWTFVDESRGHVSVNVWCPLVATTPENGNLCIIPGTHRLPRAPRIAPASEFPYAQFRAIYEPMAQAIPTKAGEAIIYDNALFHGSPANTTAQNRLIAGILMIPAAASGVLHFRSQDGCYQEYQADAEFYLRHNPLYERPNRLLRQFNAPAPEEDPETSLRRVLGLPIRALTAPTPVLSPLKKWFVSRFGRK